VKKKLSVECISTLVSGILKQHYSISTLCVSSIAVDKNTNRCGCTRESIWLKAPVWTQWQNFLHAAGLPSLNEWTFGTSSWIRWLMVFAIVTSVGNATSWPLLHSSNAIKIWKYVIRKEAWKLQSTMTHQYQSGCDILFGEATQRRETKSGWLSNTIYDCCHDLDQHFVT